MQRELVLPAMAFAAGRHASLNECSNSGGGIASLPPIDRATGKPTSWSPVILTTPPLSTFDCDARDDNNSTSSTHHHHHHRHTVHHQQPCRVLEYRGEKVAAFEVHGRELICLPQAYELFLRSYVGGLHTVYTKLKRLNITPVVCTVEQVRILRGLGSVQPGVNRCKLIAPAEFDLLYEDCTTGG